MFDPEKFVAEKVNEIKEQIGGGTALIAVSGGVDSMVCSMLTHRAVGEQLVACFIDDGLMREGEGDQVIGFLKAKGMNALIVHAQDEFFAALKGKTDPEDKRKAFRDAFYGTLARTLNEKGASHLVQGTIAADISETVRGVKTQHNVLEQIGVDYGLKVVEPLREIYKPQVREVARLLGLPEEFSERRPFPGPGLSVRILGEVTPERTAIEQKATKIVEEETDHIPCFQNMAVLLSDKGTGLNEEGGRAYGHIVIVRIVRSEDALTAEAMEVPWELLKKVEQRIITEIPEVVHVLYSLTDKPPATIEFQ